MKRLAGHIAAWALPAVILLCGGCVTPHQSTAVDVDPASWQQAAEIVVPNADTLTLRDIGIFLRCNDGFAEDSLSVRIEVLTPDSLRHEELFPFSIPGGDSPAALMREADIPYRRRAVFTRNGDYRFRITPCRPVKGVEAVGIQIEKSK